MAFPKETFVVRDLWESYANSWRIHTGEKLQSWGNLSEKERTAVIHGLRNFVDQFAAMYDISVEAKALRDTGYDGPFMGAVVVPLFQAIAKAEKN